MWSSSRTVLPQRASLGLCWESTGGVCLALSVRGLGLGWVGAAGGSRNEQRMYVRCQKYIIAASWFAPQNYYRNSRTLSPRRTVNLLHITLLVGA